jgi:hypothetical protein
MKRKFVVFIQILDVGFDERMHIFHGRAERRFFRYDFLDHLAYRGFGGRVFPGICRCSGRLFGSGRLLRLLCEHQTSADDADSEKQ